MDNYGINTKHLHQCLIYIPSTGMNHYQPLKWWQQIDIFDINTEHFKVNLTW